MTSQTNARLFAAGTDERGRPTLARLEVEGNRLRVLAREYVDPMIRSGRGGSCGLITALGSAPDSAKAGWLLAAVERGRPRLIDPERLEVVALLGRRREWRGAAEGRSPFLPVTCDRAPVSLGGREFALTRSPGGVVDLLAVRPGEPIERWRVGELASRVELLAGDGTLGFYTRDRLAIVELAELVPGGCPLLDPRDVELSLRWIELPSSVVGVCDLLAGAVRVIERHGDRWAIARLELGDKQATRRGSWAIERPERWLAAAGVLWMAAGKAWTRIELDHGPGERHRSLGPAVSPAAVELDVAGHPWLWLSSAGELLRVDGRTLAEGSIERWTIPAGLQVQRLVVAPPSPAPDPATILHADELAELLALEPGLGDAWARWFDR
ncbi:MAG: hypothetical protein R6X02_35545 [Enhygromyxa sp.]